MKTMCKFFLLTVLIVSITGCSSSKVKDGPVIISGKTPSASTNTSRNTSGHLPPGQAKKRNGDQSAKAYAPGQQKKKNNKKSN